MPYPRRDYGGGDVFADLVLVRPEIPGGKIRRNHGEHRRGAGKGLVDERAIIQVPNCRLGPFVDKPLQLLFASADHPYLFTPGQQAVGNLASYVTRCSGYDVHMLLLSAQKSRIFSVSFCFACKNYSTSFAKR